MSAAEHESQITDILFRDGSEKSNVHSLDDFVTVELRAADTNPSSHS
ncbi:hypothetical protein [Gluconobacter kondonii]|nr:hypothetical protein [Gluconobacter kondonii]MBS1053784.1 hypothetical protein [Gluconobacter kondonii]MBS1058008.1 hypothetical protein [Gluconobacter kondonii]